jgi:hypothetical protein
MQGRVCAYCGTDISEGGLDVEHYRPKKAADGEPGYVGYWWLAYDFQNYFLSCRVCNQEKHTRFPLLDGFRARFEDRDRLAEERPLLFNFATEPIDSWVSFDWHTPNGWVGPSLGIREPLAGRVAQNALFFRLNLRPAQRRKRYEIHQFVLEKVRQGKADEARKLASRYQPHSIVARDVLGATAPEAMPTPIEELQWLIEELTTELILKLEILEASGHRSEKDEGEALELLWALAVLWKTPPVGSPELVADVLERRGLKDKVAEYVNLL